MKIKCLYLGFCGVVGLVGVGLWVLMVWFIYMVNLIYSLFGYVYVIECDVIVKKGDLVVFCWYGGVMYLVGIMFIKVVMGGFGDVVKWVGNEFWVND